MLETSTSEISSKTAGTDMVFIFTPTVPYLMDNGEPVIKMDLDKFYTPMETSFKEPGWKENDKE